MECRCVHVMCPDCVRIRVSGPCPTDFSISSTISPVYYWHLYSGLGTWMDKMGDSRLGGNFGIPATPRDGCPVEIAGLLYSTVHWLGKCHEDGRFPYSGVYIRSSEKQLSYRDWAILLESSFEKCTLCLPSPSPPFSVQYRIVASLFEHVHDTVCLYISCLTRIFFPHVMPQAFTFHLDK